MEAGGAARAHRPPAKGDGFQRPADGPRAPYRGRRAMNSTDNPGEPENLIAAAIDAPEDIRDPLDGLVEKTAADVSAPFTPEALECLAALKNEDRAAFEALRAQLKKAGCRVTALDEAIAEENGEARGRGPTQADILIELVQS